MAKLVSSTYGDALFELALSEGRLDELYEEIASVRDVFLENEELVRFLNHPKVPKEEKLAVIVNVFSGRVSEETVGFLHIITDKDRYNDMIPIFDHFLKRVKDHNGIGKAVVTSAFPLSDRQKEAVETRLLETTDYKSFEMDYRVVPEILGGLVIRIGDRIVDSSLKSQIDKMTRELSRIRLS